MVTAAADNYFSAANTSKDAITVYQAVKASLYSANQTAAYHPANYAASNALEASANATLKVFYASNTYASAAQHFLAVMRESASFDREAGVDLEQQWANALSAVERESNTWNSMTASNAWKTSADLKRECSTYWISSRDAAQRANQATAGSDAAASAYPDSKRFSSACIEAGKKVNSKETIATNQLKAAQEATQAANQAFEALKRVRDAATARK